MLGQRGLHLPRALQDDVVRHARREFPREAVGLIGGTGETACRTIELPNLIGTKAFLADPYAQYQALRSLDSADLSLLAVYHSHPCGGVGLSVQDVEFAARSRYLHVVIAMGERDDEPVEIAAYEVSGQRAVEVPIRAIA